MKVAALAVIVKGCAPSAIESSTTVIANGACVCPAGIVTLAGTEISVVSLEKRDTTRLVASVPETVTVPVFGASPSRKFAGIVTLRTLVSLSCTTTFAAALVQPAAEAVMRAVCGPSMIVSSGMVREKLAVVAPRANVTPGGACAASGLSEASATVNATSGGRLSETVPASVPAFSSTDAGSESESAPPSLSMI